MTELGGALGLWLSRGTEIELMIGGREATIEILLRETELSSRDDAVRTLGRPLKEPRDDSIEN